MKKIVPITLMLLTSVISYAYQVQITGLVAGPGGNGIPETRVLIYSSPDFAFKYEMTVLTDQDGLFRDIVDVPDDFQRGTLLVRLVDCPNSQVKRLNFNLRHTELKVKLNACRNDHPNCHVEIRAQRQDNGHFALNAMAKGRGPIEFLWSTGESTETIVVSELGEYCVQMIDSTGCEDRDCIDLSDQACAVEIKVSRADVSPNGGLLVLTARTKGHGPFTYLWSTGDTTKNIRVTEDGEYCVSIVDALGCESRDCQIVETRDYCKTQIQVIASDLSNAGPLVLVAESVGTPPFEYLWSNGATTQRIEVEAAGKYCVRVTDSVGCHSGDCVDLDRRDCAVKIHVKRSHPHSDTSYFVLTARAKGRGDISYAWSTGDTTAQIRVTDPSEYCVTITDASGCQSRDCIDLKLRDECGTEIQVARAANDVTAGIALVARTKGRAPFSFIWSTGDTTQTIIPSDTGEYCVDVIDAAGCSSSDCINLSNLSDSCAVEIRGNPAGILVAVAKGAPFVRYLWNTGQTSKQIKVEEPGEYCVSITNAFGCEATACFTFEGISDSICRVKIFRKRTDTKKILLTAKVVGVHDFEFLWSTGETSQSILVDSSGDYCVTAFNATCRAEDCIKINLDNNGLSIGDIQGNSNEKRGFVRSKISPNPFQGKVDLNVETDAQGPAIVQIYTVEGQRVYEFQQPMYIGTNRISLQLDQLHAGMYFIRLMQDERIETLRIMKSE